MRAAQKLAASIGSYKEAPEVEVLAVHLPVPHVPHMNLIVSQEMLERYYADECELMLGPARTVLDAAGVKYTVKTRIGPIAESIAAEARDLGCDYLYMGTHGRSALGNMVLGSVATRVLHLVTNVPIVLVH
jgi:nucleotide-binding universal stress UspA family protein